MPLRTLTLLLMAAALIASGCTGRVPRRFEVPEDAKNPIEVRFQGASLTEMVDLVTQVCNQIPLQTVEVDHEDGYVETDWVELGLFDIGWDLSDYPPQYRFVVYVFQVGTTGGEEGVLQITGWYQPNRPISAVPAKHYDRHIPTDHPGYQLMLQLVYRLRVTSVEKDIQIITPLGRPR